MAVLLDASGDIAEVLQTSWLAGCFGFGMRESQPEDRVEQAPLEKEVTHVLEEARMIVPGIQALFGFQLIVVFNVVFRSNLDSVRQILHLVAVCWIAVSMGLIMAPAAYHRQAERGWITSRLARVASRLIQGALVSLLIGVTLDVYLIGFLIFGTNAPAVATAVLILFALVAIWFVFPAVMKARHPLPSRTADRRPAHDERHEPQNETVPY